MVSRTDIYRFLALLIGFFVLYATTAQRGLGWGDSGEFQYRILQCPNGILDGCDSFATAHPLYIALGKLLCGTPFQVTLLSSFFGALSVGGLFLCTRNLSLAILFGLSHIVWWLSCLAEVQTMNLAFTILELFLILKHLESKNSSLLVCAAFVIGVHLNCHNFALLSAPALLFLMAQTSWKVRFATVLAVCVGSAYWITAIFEHGLSNVLVGSYGAQVAGLPSSPPGKLIFYFTANLTLATLSLVVPITLAWLNRHAPASEKPKRTVLWIFFTTHILFVIRYFVPDQVTFLLPTLATAYLLLAHVRLSRLVTVALAVVQLLLPPGFYYAILAIRQPEPRSVKCERESRHAHRDDAAYFTLPWKFNDKSADRAATEHNGTWNGYPAN